jgi:hypothetical protein
MLQHPPARWSRDLRDRGVRPSAPVCPARGRSPRAAGTAEAWTSPAAAESTSDAEPGAGHDQVNRERPGARADVEALQGCAGLGHVEDVFGPSPVGQGERGPHALQQPVIGRGEAVLCPGGRGDGVIVIGVQGVPGRAVDRVPPPGREVSTEGVCGPGGGGDLATGQGQVPAAVVVAVGDVIRPSGRVLGHEVFIGPTQRVEGRVSQAPRGINACVRRGEAAPFVAERARREAARPSSTRSRAAASIRPGHPACMRVSTNRRCARSMAALCSCAAAAHVWCRGWRVTACGAWDVIAVTRVCLSAPSGGVPWPMRALRLNGRTSSSEGRAARACTDD